MFIGNGCVSRPNNTTTKNKWFYFVQAGLPHTSQVFEGEAANEMKECRLVRGIVAPGLVLRAVPDSKSSRVNNQAAGSIKRQMHCSAPTKRLAIGARGGCGAQIHAGLTRLRRVLLIYY